jgi:hypothetical protein
MIRFTFQDAAFQRKLGKIVVLAKNPVAILMAGGREVANQLKKHFRDKDRSSGNKLSDRRSHFWLQVAQSVTQPQQTGYNAIGVSVTDPRFAHKVYGDSPPSGPIRAKNAGALTIPVEERAYGRSAATFERETGLKLFLVHSGHGKFEELLLAVKDDPKSQFFTVEYILTKSVTQQADTTALPDKTMLQTVILLRAQKVLDSQLGGETSTATNE